MIKKLYLVLFTLVTLTLQPAQSGPIIIVWPSYVDSSTIYPQEILGTWMAWDKKRSWIVNLERDQRTGLIKITMQSTSSQTYQGVGKLHPNVNTLYGRITMDHGRTHSVLLFRDQEGTKLRIIVSKTNYSDLILSSFRFN